MRHAQGRRKFDFRLRKTWADSLWRSQFVSGLLSRFCNSTLSSAFGSMALVRPLGVPSRRSVSGRVSSIVAAWGRVENTQGLIHNGLIHHLLGLNDFLHCDTLRTFLRRFGRVTQATLSARYEYRTSPEEAREKCAPSKRAWSTRPLFPTTSFSSLCVATTTSQEIRSKLLALLEGTQCTHEAPQRLGISAEHRLCANNKPIGTLRPPMVASSRSP